MKKYLLLLKALLGNSNISTNEYHNKDNKVKREFKNIHNLRDKIFEIKLQGNKLRLFLANAFLQLLCF